MATYARLRSKVGTYKLLNLTIKGFDFVVLEKYQSYVHKTLKKLDIDVPNAYSVPHTLLLVENLAHRSTAIENSQRLKRYERVIQMRHTPVTKLPIVIDLVHMTAPAGVSFSIDHHTKRDEDRIHFKDTVLQKLQEDLAELKDIPLIGQ